MIDPIVPDNNTSEVPEDVNPLDNFDLRTPAQVEASKADEPAESPVSDDTKTDDNTDKTGTEPEKGDEPEEGDEPTKGKEDEPKAYVPPQKVKLELKPFEAEIPKDEYGNVDPTKLQEFLQQFAENVKENAEIKATNALYDNMYVQREWQDVGKAFPEIVEDENLRMMTEKLRTADAIQGGEGSLMEAAKQIKTLVDSKVAEGKTSQQKSITKQKSVSLSNSKRPTGDAQAVKMAELRKKAYSGGPGSDDARVAYIRQLHEDGKL